jgi:hypothetical protein
MKEIPLTQGKVALVDDEDYEELSKYKWCAHKHGRIFYAVRCTPKKPQKMIRMHRIVNKTPEDLFTDHIDGDGLNNQKSNLRTVTTRENCQNHHHPKSSKYPGVTLHHGLWQARIEINKELINLGFFKIEEDAYKKYKEACEHPENIVRRVYTSKHNGVFFYSKKNRWISRIQQNGKRVYLGCFEREIDAANACKVYRYVHGEKNNG